MQTYLENYINLDSIKPFVAITPQTILYYLSALYYKLLIKPQH